MNNLMHLRKLINDIILSFSIFINWIKTNRILIQISYRFVCFKKYYSRIKPVKYIGIVQLIQKSSHLRIVTRKSEMFHVTGTGTAVPAMSVVFPNSWRRPFILPLRSTKTLKPLAFLDLKGGKGYTHFSKIGCVIVKLSS